MDDCPIPIQRTRADRAAGCRLLSSVAVRSNGNCGRRAAGSAGFLPWGTEAGQLLNFCAFGEAECILGINAKITDCAFDLRLAEQDLNGAQLAVDGEIEQRAVSEASLSVEPEPDGPPC